MIDHAVLLAAVLSVSPPQGAVDPEAFSTAVEQATAAYEPWEAKNWAALLIAIAAKESSMLARIAANECKPWECDPIVKRGVRTHLAWGLFQEHSNKNNEKVWGSPEISVQVASALDMLRRGRATCALGVRSDAWVALTINGYAGKRCDNFSWKGLSERLSIFHRVRRQLR